ncbi:hypothetical protein [Butyricicoccus faecihominis]|uniref:hypothetical protein n=1 Tax=Butyricicoccus faecihominis TaxID=1712515 RepID=UPI002479F00A|nr:hypothetical protein [Butyricicoccus faecihominis]
MPAVAATANRVYPNFCDQLLDAFNEYVEENYINFYALNSHLKNSLKNLNPQSEPAFKSNVLPSIEQSLTVQDAINTLENHFKDLPNKSNHSDGIKTIINKYFAEHQIPKYPVSLNDGHYVWLYQRLLHLCFNIVGHYGVALLIHCKADRNESDKAE